MITTTINNMNKTNKMNPFIVHTQAQGVSYLEHWFFALGIAGRLMISVIAFALHGIFPFIDIAKRHDLEATMAYLNERNEWIESQEKVIPTYEQPDFGDTEPLTV